jgi:hypothetical protein
MTRKTLIGMVALTAMSGAETISKRGSRLVVRSVSDRQVVMRTGAPRTSDRSRRGRLCHGFGRALAEAHVYIDFGRI